MPTTWTKITKASGTSWTKIAKPILDTGTAAITAGTPIGLLLALTYGEASGGEGATWTKVAKASGTSWTKVAKAT